MSFPLRIGPLGHFERSEGIDKRIDDLRVIVLTEKGERIMRVSFGTISTRAVFRKMGELEKALLKDLIVEAVAENTSDTVVAEIDLDEKDDGKFIVSLSVAVEGSGENVDFMVELQ